LLWRFRNDNKNNGNNSNNNTSDDKTPASTRIVPAALVRNQPLLKEAVHDAWTRLLRRRGTTRLWTDKCKDAQDRACQVFEDNLQRALLAPPHHIPARPIVALDPGFAAGIKCALLESDGGVTTLDTVRFLGSETTRNAAVAKLEAMLNRVQSQMLSSSSSVHNAKDLDSKTVTVALGNGHGSADCRKLVEEASINSGIPLDIQLVNEAGASVWSVAENAHAEFPDHPPAAIAAISIGRRLQNPLFELVKVPPRSLGLGMYQHDLSEKELDENLQRTSVDAVATVGVDINSGSLEILQKVPGLSASLSKKIIASRPLKRRRDLLTIGGLGPKSYENCAGFVRVSNGPEALDDTLVHPESYELARWLLKEFSWELDRAGNDSLVKKLPPREDWKAEWKDPLTKAANKYNVSQDRVLAVLGNLVDSMSKQDPRLKILESDYLSSGKGSTSSSSVGLVESCKPLPATLSDTNRLAQAISERGGPIRGIVGTIRNVADFGAFVDIGNENNGLLHVSKLGPNLQLQSLLIGQQVGIDILSVAPDTARISLGVHGCKLEASAPRNSKPNPSTRTTKNQVRGSSSSSSNNRISGSKRTISATTSGKSKNSGNGTKRIISTTTSRKSKHSGSREQHRQKRRRTER